MARRETITLRGRAANDFFRALLKQSEIDAMNRGPFAPGPFPAPGERCPRCHVTRRLDPCLLCNPEPLWPLAARNLADAYRPEGIP